MSKTKTDNQELLKELEELMKSDEEDQNKKELSPEDVKIQIAEMESGNNFTEEDLELLKELDQEESDNDDDIELKDYNPRIELRKFGKNLKKDLAETNPKPSVESPAGSKTNNKRKKVNDKDEGEGGCCSIS